jgi:hypothetical protein
MKIIAALLLVGSLAQDIGTEFIPPTEQEVAILASGLLRLKQERDLARDERDAAKEEISRLRAADASLLHAD